MKAIFTSLFLFIIITSAAQSNFTSATLINRDNTTQTVYIKNKTLIIDKEGNLNIYKNPDSSSKLDLSQLDFKSLESIDKNMFLIKTTVDGLNDNQPIVLRKLVDGKRSLYQFTAKDKSVWYVDESAGIFTYLSNDNVQKVKYRQWLFNNFNSKNQDVKEFITIEYSEESLSSYYIDNNASSTLLAQEKEVKPFKFSVNAGFSSSTINLSSPQYNYEKISASGLRLGIRANYSLDRVKNRHNIVGGINYYLPNEGNSTSVSPNTGDMIRTDIETSYLSFSIGYQYNFHFNKATISPYVNLEPTFLIGNNSIAADLNETDELYFTDTFKSRPHPFNIGLNIDVLEKGYIFVEYSLTFQSTADATNNFSSANPSFTITNNTDRVSVGLGFYIF